MKLSREFTWESQLSLPEFIAALDKFVDPVEEFRLISKVSGAGIVTRVLEGPEQNSQFWGRLDTEPYRIVQHVPKINRTPYQPIVHIVICTNDQASKGTLQLRPHSQATMFAVAEYFGAALCSTAGLWAMQQNPIGALGVVLGLALVLFPTWRARAAFEDELLRCLEGLKNLPLEWTIIEACDRDSSSAKSDSSQVT